MPNVIRPPPPTADHPAAVICCPRSVYPWQEPALLNCSFIRKGGRAKPAAGLGGGCPAWLRPSLLDGSCRVPPSCARPQSAVPHAVPALALDHRDAGCREDEEGGRRLTWQPVPQANVAPLFSFVSVRRRERPEGTRGNRVAVKGGWGKPTSARGRNLGRARPRWGSWRAAPTHPARWVKIW